MHRAGLAAACAFLTFAVWAEPAAGQEGRVNGVSRAPFARVAAALEKAIAEEKMALV